MKILKLLCLGVATIAALNIVATLAVAQQQTPPPLVVKQLKPDVYWTEGGNGGNTGFIIGKTGVVVIDAKTSPDSAKEMLADIAKVTPKPVTHVILTHSDADHVNGLAGFPMGLVIIAHENNKKEQEAALAAGGRGAPPTEYLPTMVVRNKETLTLDGEKIELLHWGPAHTSGDLVVYLPEQKIVFTGDIAATNHPFARIHNEKAGSSAGWVESMKKMIALDSDAYVTGHGEVQTKADLRAHLAKVQERREKVKAMVAQGKSLTDVLAALPDSEAVPGQPTVAGPQGLSFTAVVYQEYSKH